MKLASILWNELRKEILTTLGYKSQWLGEFLALIIFYLFLNKLSGRSDLSAYCYCLWFYSVLIIGDISGKITTEMRLGTFEQMYLSTFSIISLLTVKIITSIIRCGLLMLSLLFLLFLNGYIFLNTLFDPLLWLAALCITPGLFGISLILGGITLSIKDTAWIVNIVNNSTLFLSGIFLSTEAFPNWIQNLSILIPTTQAITLLYQNDFSPINWALFGASSLVYLLIGLACFFLFDRRAKEKGVLGHY